MNLLEFGMENRKSSSVIRRCLAKAALNVEIMRADLIEKKLDRQHIVLPKEPDSDKMLEEIKRRINEKK